MTLRLSLMMLGFLAQVCASSASIAQPVHPPCTDQSLEQKSDVRNPYRILLGTYPDLDNWHPPQKWELFLSCEVEIYEDAQCTLRFVTGTFWNSSNAQRLVDYLLQHGIRAEMFVFAYQNQRIVGWGNWIDFGQRKE